MREKQEAKFAPGKAQLAARDAERNELGRIQKPLPVERVLTDNQDRDLDARIVGKNKTHLTVIRKEDGERFDIAIANLSEADQDFVAGLLDQRATEAELGTEEVKVDPEIERWTRKLESIDEEIREVADAIADPRLGKNSPRRRGLQAESERLQKEKREVEEWLRKASAYDEQR